MNFLRLVMTNINRVLLTVIFSLGIPFQVLANTADDLGISNDNFMEISQRVNSMSLIELTTTKAQLEAEQDNLNDSVGGTQSPSENKKISSGIYYYTIETKEAFNRKKMVLIK